MALPTIPTRHQDSGAHRQRIAETVNGVTSFQFDDSRVMTQAEITASVTPVNYAYAPGDIRRYGAKVDGITNDSAAITAAGLVASQSSGGIAVYFPAGTTRYTGDLSLQTFIKWRGDGMWKSVLQALDSTGRVLLGSGHNTLSDLQLLGSVATAGAYVGTGLQIAESDFAGDMQLSRMVIQNFQVGVRLAGALYTNLTSVWVRYNRTGLDFNALSGSHYSTSVTFSRCVFQNNERCGIDSSNTPIRNVTLSMNDCVVEENGTSAPATYPQIKMSRFSTVSITKLHMEYNTAGTKPDAIQLFDVSEADISPFYIVGSANGIRDVGGASCSYIHIANGRFISTTTMCLDLAGEDHVTYQNVDADNTITVTGTRCGEIVTQADTTFTPVLRGASTAGTPTYTVQSAFYSRANGHVFFQLRISISAKGSMAGNIEIAGLPATSVNKAGQASIFAARFDGVTVSGGNTCFHAELPANSTVLQLWQSGSTASSQIQDTQLAAATSIFISGFYKEA